MDILVDKIFDNNLPSIEEIYNKYQARNLKPEQKVTRVAPSPTGFVHIGTIYMALISERIAHLSDGIFYLRIEDTDEKREKPGATDALAKALNTYNIKTDEGVTSSTKEFGQYGPYKQSNRKHIYQAFIKDMLLRGLAYVCFCSEDELNSIVEQQKAQACPRLGYYGNWAKYRNFPIDEAIKKIDNGEEFVIRFKSPGNFNNKIVVNDLIKGKREFPENDLDIVIMKRNGLPTYHFAHIIDDFLMGTTLVTRGDEWFPSLPLHLQLFKAMGWKPPKYAHISPIMKIDQGGKRKLSKRKDFESNIDFYEEQGYPTESVIEYLMNLANSNFEDWRKQNPTTDYKEFNLVIHRMNTSGALFDFTKLNSVSRGIIGRFSANEIYDKALAWAGKFDQDFYKLLLGNKDYTKQILSIERDDPKKVRKDIAKWSDLKNEIMYFFDLDETLISKNLENFDQKLIKEVSSLFVKDYNPNDTNLEWFEKIKNIANQLNYATDMKAYKTDPTKYNGTVADIATILRILTTGRAQSPDLYSIMKVLGEKEVIKRIARF